MKPLFLKFIMAAAVLVGCISCVDVDPQLGSNLIPNSSKYMIFSSGMPIENVQMRMADSLSGFSDSRIVIGAVRDEDFGLSTRSCALTLIPLVDTVDFGNVQGINYFTLSAAFDTTSTSQPNQSRILQTVKVYALEEGLDYTDLTDANDVAQLIKHGDQSVIKGTPILNGVDDLYLEFTDDYAMSMVNWLNGKILSDSLTFDAFLDKFPGIYIGTDEPAGYGGRINSFDLQLGYNSSYYYLEDNYGELSINAIFDETVGAVDTSFFFYYGAQQYYDSATLTSDYETGTFPQYAFNITGHSTRDKAGAASDKLYVEGGAGLKPVIKATDLVSLARKCIADSLAANGLDESLIDKAIINKATIVLPFDIPEDLDRLDNYFPPRLSPTCRITTDSTSTFMGLTDASSDYEDQGDINRSLCVYSPDITYHLQQLLQLDSDNEYLVKGNYDIWMLVMNEITTTTSTSSSSDLSEYYQYLAYQSYYNSMYSGYSSYGSSYYSNYYSYLLAAMYASGTTSTSTSFELDQDLYYKAELCGPQSDTSVPELRLIFSVPKQ